MTITYAPRTKNPKAPLWARSESRMCFALETLRAQLNAACPNRDRASDGFLGDDRHLAAGTGSDHNAWFKVGDDFVVRGGDFDKDGINPDWFAEQLRLAGAAGDPRLADGGYVIWNGHITTPDFKHWTPYLGDPHTGHVHVSMSRTDYCDSPRPWVFLTMAAPVAPPADPGPIRPAPAPAPAAPAAAPAVDPDMHAPAAIANATNGSPYVPTGSDARGAGAGFRADAGDAGPRVLALQQFFNAHFGLYSDLVEDGVYWQKTGAVVAEFAARCAGDPNTPGSDVPGLTQSDGQNVGPRIARRLAHFGFN